MRTVPTFQLFLKSIAFAMMLAILFSSTYSSINFLFDFECIELCDLGDIDTEEEKNEKEKDDKVKEHAFFQKDQQYENALSMANKVFLQAHQFVEITTPPPEFFI